MIARLRSVLALPVAYRWFHKLVGVDGRSRVLVGEFIRPKPGDRILEIGCGPGTIIPYLGKCDYVGFDLSSEYIDYARKRFPRAKFVCESVSEYALPEGGKFDVVLALGVLHHLTDEEALQLFQIAHAALKPGGRLITHDGVWTNEQSRAARYLLSRDRGQYVRTEEAYRKLAARRFDKVKSSVRDGLLRIPYTHIMLECTR